MVSVASKFGVVLANFGTHQHFLQLLLSNCFNRKSSIFANNSLLSRITCDPEGTCTLFKCKLPLFKLEVLSVPS